MRKYIPKEAKLIPAQASCAFRGKIWDVYQWPQKLYDGSTTTFEMLRRPDTVKIIGVKDDKVIVTKQEQPGDAWFYDYPGGRVDKEDADELEAAQREMREETGMEFTNWKLVKVEQPFSKIDWLIYTFVANDYVGKSAQQLDGGEKIAVAEMTIDEIKNLHDGDPHRLKYMDLGQFGCEINTAKDLLNLPEIYQY